MPIQTLLQQSAKTLKKSSTTPLLDAEVFLCEAIKKPREFILANMDYKLSESEEKRFWQMVERRKKFEPVAYIVNKKEFFGLEFYVDSNVLIPRPETEMMVEVAMEFVGAENFQPLQINIIDVGTGSGCIIGAVANTLKLEREELPFEKPPLNLPLPKEERINFFALDNNKETLKIAEKNLKNLNLPIKFLHGDLLEPYLRYCSDRSRPVTTIEIILANLPYLNAEEYKKCPPEVKNYEPKSALYGGKDGLRYIKKLIAQIEKSGLENYWLILEISPAQAKYLREKGFEIKKDLYGIKRFAFLSCCHPEERVA